MANSLFRRAFRKSFKVHTALQSVANAGAPGDGIDPAKVAQKLREENFAPSRSDAELAEVIKQAASDVGVALMPRD